MGEEQSEVKLYRAELISESDPSINAGGVSSIGNCYDAALSILDRNLDAIKRPGVTDISIRCYEISQEEFKALLLSEKERR